MPDPSFKNLMRVTGNLLALLRELDAQTLVAAHYGDNQAPEQLLKTYMEETQKQLDGLNHDKH